MHRNEVARLNHWAVDRPHLQHAMRVCFSKFAALLTDDEWLRLKNIGMYVKVLPLRSWSKDFCTFWVTSGEGELYAARMAAQQVMGMESTAKDEGISHTTMEWQAGANASIGFIGRQRLGKVRRIDLNYFSIQAAVRAKPNRLKKIPTCDNMADIGTKMLDKDAF